MGVSHAKLEEEFAALGPVQPSSPMALPSKILLSPAASTVVPTLRLDLQHVQSSSTDEGSAESTIFSEYESTVSMIYPHLFLGGCRVAASKDILDKHGIKQIVNCSHCIIPNYFENDSDIEYLSINLYDKKDESIHWFISGVIQFIERGRRNQRSTLLHCEKGISRSCAFAIAYRMWLEKSNFVSAFSYVKQIRPTCNPNSGFICNLIELQNVFNLSSNPDFYCLFRCAFHSADDRDTVVLKICLDDVSRKLLPPLYPHFLSEGVYVICPVGQKGTIKDMYIWKGASASELALSKSIALSRDFERVLHDSAELLVVQQEEESPEFKRLFKGIPCSEDMKKSFEFKDLYSGNLISVPVKDIDNHISLATKLSLVDGDSFPGCVEASQLEYGRRRPKLFILSRDEHDGCTHWQDMGLYDDSDLDEVLLRTVRGTTFTPNLEYHFASPSAIYKIYLDRKE